MTSLDIAMLRLIDLRTHGRNVNQNDAWKYAARVLELTGGEL